MKKIAIISTVGLKYDGITSVILSYLEAMDLKGLDIFIIATNTCEPKIVAKLNQLGCHIIQLPSRTLHTAMYFVKLSMFIHTNQIEVIHAHGNSATLAIEMFAAWLGGCKIRIAHSHNTKCEQVFADKILRPIFYTLYTKGLACSNEAGSWLFKNRKFFILTNGRDITKYKFSQKYRNEMRKKLGINNEICIGHVGGFYEQKNHDFLLKVFKEIKKLNKNVKFFLIGDGPLRDKIKKNSYELNITFTGNINNVSDYLNVMDGMLLPSIFEGLPLVAIEWQINGLPCILSNKITKECSLVENIKFKNLDNPSEWAKEILYMIKTNDRKKQSVIACDIIQNTKFNIIKEAQTLKKIYIRGAK